MMEAVNALKMLLPAYKTSRCHTKDHNMSSVLWKPKVSYQNYCLFAWVNSFTHYLIVMLDSNTLYMSLKFWGLTELILRL